MSINIIDYFNNHNGGSDNSVGVLVSLSINFVITLAVVLGTFAILLSYAKGNDSTPHRMLIVSMIFADFLIW